MSGEVHAAMSQERAPSKKRASDGPGAPAISGRGRSARARVCVARTMPCTLSTPPVPHVHMLRMLRTPASRWHTLAPPPSPAGSQSCQSCHSARTPMAQSATQFHSIPSKAGSATGRTEGSHSAHGGEMHVAFEPASASAMAAAPYPSAASTLPFPSPWLHC